MSPQDVTARVRAAASTERISARLPRSATRSLFVDAGSSCRGAATQAGLDNCLVVVPDAVEGRNASVLLAVADVLPDHAGPMHAAHDAVRALARSYYTAPDGWTTEQALRESFEAASSSIRSVAGHGGAVALSALVLRQRRWSLAHVGHTRIWLLRDHQLKLLTRDHIAPRVGKRPQVTRACGLAGADAPDAASGELADGDVFLLTTGGVHDTLDVAVIMSCLIADTTADQMVGCLTQRAAISPSRNASACILRVEKLPAETNADLAENIASLPVIAPPGPGDTVDGFRIQSLMHKSRMYRLYKSTDEESGGTVVLKFPNPRLARRTGFLDSFLREEWIAKRVDNPYLVKPLPLRAGRRTALYSMLAYQKGENLAKRIRRKGGLSQRETLRHAEQLLAALEQLHREGIIHRDVRPKNILVDRRNKRLCLLGLGTTQIEDLSETTQGDLPAGVDFAHLAPELFSGKPATVQSDIYAAGVTVYRMLTARYPYGRVRNLDTPPHTPFTPPTHHKPELPAWLAAVLEQACALDPRERFRSAGEFSEALQRGAEGPRAPAGAPARSGSRAWEWALPAAVLGGLLLYLLTTVFVGK